MKNRLFRITVCFALIFTLVFCEATMCFATDVPSPVEERTIAADEVALKSYTFKNGTEYTYTGAQIKPVIKSVVVDVTHKDQSGTPKTITKTVTSFKTVSYKDNVSIGTGYVIVTIEGKKVEIPFSIRFGKVTSLKTEPISYKTIKLKWNKVPGAAGYIVYRSIDKSGGFKQIKTVRSGSTTSFKNTGLTLGTTYYYKVRPYRVSEGTTQYGENSKVVSQKAQPATPVITGFWRVNYQTIKVSWGKVSGADGYRVYRSNSPNGEYKRIATIRKKDRLYYNDTGRKCGIKYYYKIRAYKTSGIKKIYSDASKYKVARTVPNRTQFNEETTSWYSSAELHWDKAKGATGYVMYRSKSAKSGYKLVKTITNGKTTKWTNTGLNGSTKYYYKIKPYRVVKGKKVYSYFSKVYTKYLVPKKLSTLIKKYEGTRYRFGGNTPKGWDCSGFVQWATYYLKGKKIGRTAGDQARGGKYVNKNKMSTWKPGDVLVYKRNGGGVSHVGLYIGGGKMMHALNSRYDTIIQDVDYYERWDGGNYLAAVRRY